MYLQTQHPGYPSLKLSGILQYLAVAALLLLAFIPESAFASEGAGGGLPYEGWLTQLRNSVTGPLAFTLAIIGIVVAGGMLVMGGDLSGFFRALILLILVISLLVGAQNMMSSFFGRGAEISSAPYPMLHAQGAHAQVG